MSSKKKIFRQVICLAAALLLGMAGMDRTVDAAEQTQTGSICLRYPVTEGAEFGLFRAGEITEDWEFVLTGAFQEIQADINDLDTESMTALSETLAAYAAADGISPDVAGVTDENGEALFEGLEKGLYLVVGERVVQDGLQYDPVPFLVTVPSMNEEGEWVYQTEVDVKYEISVPTGEDTRYQVVKHWEGDQNGTSRPVQITVEILKDGEVYTTQTLSRENNWSYAWTAKADGSVWSVVERDIPEGYVVKVEQNQTMFILTNSYTGDTPGEGPKTGDPSGLVPSVSLLALSGMSLVVIGLLLMRNRKEKGHE